VEWLHPVTLEEEVSVDVKVATVIGADLDTEFCLNILLVEVLADPSESGVTQVARILTLATNIIDVLLKLALVIKRNNLCIPVRFFDMDRS
jgi:hypothetical protein